MITQSEYLEDQRKQREFNNLSDTVIKFTPFAQWYPLMVQASNLLTNNLPKRVGINSQGRPIVVYQGDVSKFLAIAASAEHKKWADLIAKKDYGNLALNILTGGLSGNIKKMVEQKSNKTQVFNLSPKDVSMLWAKKISVTQPEKAKEIFTAILKDETKENETKKVPETVIKPVTEKKPNFFIFVFQKIFGK